MLDFFAERAGHLLNEELWKLFDQLLFEPQAFRERAGLSFDDSNAEDHVPVEWSERAKLGTPSGILMHELLMR